LVATVIVVPLLQRLRASPVLGYLAVGVVIGPFGLGLVEDLEGVRTLAQLGVVFLLFTIGLDLSLERLWTMRHYVFGLGAAQVLVTGTVISAIAWAWGNTAQASLVLGACLALSSTAIVAQLLIERGEIGSRFGRATFGILLFQDLAIVPILFMVNVFGLAGDGPILVALGLAVAWALAAVAIVYVLGRLLLRPMFRTAAGTRSPEVLMAMTLLTILATASGTHLAGLSMALGAFLAGVLLAETEFRHQVEIDIQPFKGLLLGLFFMSVGMGIDLAAVADRAFWIGASVAGLIAIKAVIAAGLCVAFGLRRSEAARAGLLLGQGGEFAFIIVGAAMILGLMPEPVGQFMLVVAGLSMVATPFIAVLGRHVATFLAAREAAVPLGAAEDAGLEGHLLIAGFGRVGQTVAKLMESEKMPFAALDLDAERVAQCRKLGIPVYYGDARRKEALERLGVDRAAAVVITLDDPDAAGRVVSNIRKAWPELRIFVRARDTTHAAELVALGADHVVPETVESSLQLAGRVLHAMGTPMDAVNRLIELIRKTGNEGLGRVIEGDGGTSSPVDESRGGV
jgi:CPA2 family monovalent cation:H+ antiporter-2